MCFNYAYIIVMFKEYSMHLLYNVNFCMIVFLFIIVIIFILPLRNQYIELMPYRKLPYCYFQMNTIKTVFHMIIILCNCLFRIKNNILHRTYWIFFLDVERIVHHITTLTYRNWKNHHCKYSFSYQLMCDSKWLQLGHSWMVQNRQSLLRESHIFLQPYFVWLCICCKNIIYILYINQ